MAAKNNQIGFRLPPDYVDIFHEEAKRQGISIHEFAKKMSVQGMISTQNGGEHDQLVAKNTIFSVCLLQELIKKILPEIESNAALSDATTKAIEAIKSADIEV